MLINLLLLPSRTLRPQIRGPVCVLVWPLSADVPEAGCPGQDLLPLGVPPHHHPAVLLTQQTLQLRVHSVLAHIDKGWDREMQKDNTVAPIYEYDDYDHLSWWGETDTPVSSTEQSSGALPLLSAWGRWPACGASAAPWGHRAGTLKHTVNGSNLQISAICIFSQTWVWVRAKSARTSICINIENVNYASITTTNFREDAWTELMEVYTGVLQRGYISSEALTTLWVPRFGRQLSTAWARPGFFSFPSLNNRTGRREGTCRHTYEAGWRKH